MVSVSEILHSFDRKERAWVVRNALGSMSPPLDPAFLRKLSEKLGLEQPLPANAWWGIDYHLDWLAAALHAFRLNASSNAMIQQPEKNDKGWLIHGIEDIDLIIADASRIILIEAKAFGNWSRGQLDSKLGRLRNLLPNGDVVWDAQHTHSVRIFFVLMSMKHPPRENVYKDWLPWMLRNGAPVWIRMETSHEGSVKRPVRCDENGIESGLGTYWKTKIESIHEVGE